MVSLEELYSRDPNKWTDAEIDKIVEGLRSARTKFVEEEKAAAAKAKAEKPAKAPAIPGEKKTAKVTQPPLGGLSLASLGIQIVPPSAAPATPAQPEIPFGPSTEEPLS